MSSAERRKGSLEKYRSHRNHVVLPHTHAEGEHGRTSGPHPSSEGQIEGTTVTCSN